MAVSKVWGLVEHEPLTVPVKQQPLWDSPYLEMCCLRISATVSYAHASEDIVL